MRLWSLDPKYLDTKGLIAAWREGLLAQKVLEGKTQGYTKHPQLLRFNKTTEPILYISYFLHIIQQEAERREYNFDITKIKYSYEQVKHLQKSIKCNNEQLKYEWAHLLNKLQHRDPVQYQLFVRIKIPRSHSLFSITTGPIESWEKIS